MKVGRESDRIINWQSNDGKWSAVIRSKKQNKNSVSCSNVIEEERNEKYESIGSHD